MSGPDAVGKASSPHVGSLIFLIALVVVILGISASAGVLLWGLIAAALALIVFLFWPFVASALSNR